MAPVRYVRVCNAYGKGFFYLPGTQTCLQVSGLARMDVDYTQPFTRGSDAFGFRTRGVVNFDVRTQT
ncbi:MAG TPA: porin, partial [Hyphomicrobiales bacterium]|nr:porin [Hyphomicrobiales bacterium]